MTMEPDGAETDGKSGFSLCLTTDKTEYTVGETVRMTIAAANHTSSDLSLSFKDAQRFDFYIEQEGKEVWRWSQGRMFAQELGHEKLGPGASLGFSAKCEKKLEPVLYQITGMILADPSPLIARINIVIR